MSNKILILIGEDNIIRNKFNKAVEMTIFDKNISLENMVVRTEEELLCEFYMLHYKTGKQVIYERFIENIVNKCDYHGLVIIDSKYDGDNNFKLSMDRIVRANEISYDEMLILKRKIEL